MGSDFGCEPNLRRALRRKKAIEAAAVEYVGWRSTSYGRLNPQEHWEARTHMQNKAAIELTTSIIEAYEKVMFPVDSELAEGS